MNLSAPFPVAEQPCTAHAGLGQVQPTSAGQERPCQHPTGSVHAGTIKYLYIRGKHYLHTNVLKKQFESELICKSLEQPCEGTNSLGMLMSWGTSTEPVLNPYFTGLY